MVKIKRMKSIDFYDCVMNTECSAVLFLWLKIERVKMRNRNLIMKRSRYTVPVIIGLLVFNISHVLSQYTPSAAVRSITIKELRHHMFFLASDSLRGRVTGTPGYQIAARYADKEFRAAGLKSILLDSLGNDTFLQPVPFTRKKETDRGRLIITSPEGERVFIEGRDFKFSVFLANDYPGTPRPVVFVGYGIDEPDAGWNDYEGLDLTGKIAVMLPGAPKRNGKPILPEKLHKLYSTGDGDGKRMVALFKRRPAALLLLANTWRSENWEKFGNSANRIRVVYAGDKTASISNRSSKRRGSQIVIRKHVLDTLLEDQKYSPVHLMQEGIEGYMTFDLKETTIHYCLDITGNQFDSWNVVGMVEGSDPILKDEIITVGAHLDHVQARGGQICNGADDNASGSIGVMEIAEAVAMDPPRRSVVFILYTAEEMGLWGSKHFVFNCPVPIEKVKVNINLDMIGRTCKQLKENRAHYVVGADAIWPEFKDIIADVNKRTVDWPLVFKSKDQFRGGSDHVSFEQKGIPAVFFFSGEHEDLHRPTDDPEKIEFDKLQKISQLVYEIVMELGDREDIYTLRK